MKNKFQLLTLVLAVSALTSACTNKAPDNSSSEPEAPRYTVENYVFKKIYGRSTERTLAKYNERAPRENGYTTFLINKDVGDAAFFRIEVESDVALIGHISYTNSENPSETNDEKFFIEKGQTVYRAFLDSFRMGAYGNFKKIINKVTLKNVDGTQEGHVTVKEISISNRKYDPNYLMYISDATAELGLSLSFGGAVQSFKRKDANLVEYLAPDGTVHLERDIDPDEVRVIDEDPNLINIFDLGREAQLSYYWYVDESNEYYPTTEKKYPGTLRYNPIQCGSAGDVYPQIVDYTYSKDRVWIKSYGQDWFLENQVDPTYYEVTFRMVGDDSGVVISDTKTTNFSEFIGVKKIPATGQEAPAFYVVQPFNYFYCETTEGIFFDDNLYSDTAGYPRKTSPKDNITGRHSAFIDTKIVPNKWMAWVNDQMFGVGLYHPTAAYYNACRYTHTTEYNDYGKSNCTVKASMYDEASSPHGYNPSAHVSNSDYMCPVIYASQLDFIPLEFSYAFFAGDVEEMQEIFDGMAEEKTFYRELAWPNHALE